MLARSSSGIHECNRMIRLQQRFLAANKKQCGESKIKVFAAQKESLGNIFDVTTPHSRILHGTRDCKEKILLFLARVFSVINSCLSRAISAQKPIVLIHFSG